MDVKGFKVNFLGDSITEGLGVADIENCRYDNHLKKICGLSAVNNYGISGTRIAHQTKPTANPRQDLCFCGRVYNMDTTADMVVVYGGVNDYLHGDAPFGKLGDSTPATFCGGVHFLMKFLRENYTNKPVIFMTPARCTYEGGDDLAVSIYDNKLADARPLIDYVEVIEETAKQFVIPVLNLYKNLGIDPHDPEQYEKYTVDGLHFNNDGQMILARCLKNFIEKL